MSVICLIFKQNNFPDTESFSLIEIRRIPYNAEIQK